MWEIPSEPVDYKSNTPGITFVIHVIEAHHTLLRAQRLKKSISLEFFQSRLKFAIPLENFSLDLQNSPQKKNRGLAGGSLENFNLA